MSIALGRNIGGILALVLFLTVWLPLALIKL